MGPESDDLPTCGSKTLVSFDVTCDVGLDLRAPELRVLLRPRGVSGATMPEAAVDKDGDVEAAERDVGDPAGLGENLNLDAVTKAARVQLTA